MTQSDGTVIYPGQGSASVVVPSPVGAQMLAVSADGAAAAHCSREVGLDAGRRLAVVAGGAAGVHADGTTEHLITALWATDAHRREVATDSDVEGIRLTQVVDHVSAGDVARPVVADPIVIGFLVRRCSMGTGLNGPQIAPIAERGTRSATLSAGGRVAVRCTRRR
ncbi:hypothetical protein [Geodermatophilus maliterrae]|uniref:Uncharacterized protein n=1 Tax=Geodermatophilus maliterrae TaxID=3162531 RepID=A0ABV3XJ38_9ACTN